MIQSLANFLRRRQQKWNSGQMLSILAHSLLEVHCSYRLKFFVAKNHLRSSSPSNCSLLCSRFARSCSPRPSQRSKYTEGVALRMRICTAVQRLSRKWVQKKNTPCPVRSWTDVVVTLLLSLYGMHQYILTVRAHAQAD